MPRKLIVRPDFIIAGAMKSGTTSLHVALASHPEVFMPPGEIQLFTIDDYEQHPQLFACANGEWRVPDFDDSFDAYAQWHAGRHALAPQGAILGEDAPTYLASRVALDRIAELAPASRIIIILRDPVERVYSHYWHLVRNFQARLSLEDTLRFQAGNLLQRSFYEEQVRRYFDVLGRDRVHVVIFEEFVKDQQTVLRGILDFLALDPAFLDSATPTHANRGGYARSPALALWRNRLLSGLFGRRYLGRIPLLPEAPPLSTWDRSVMRISSLVNPRTNRPPPRNAATEGFLYELLRRRNAGLSALLGRDLSGYWATFRDAA